MLDGLRHRVYVLWRGERYGREHDLPVFIGSTLALLVAGIVASTIPSLRAARVDPVAALRAD